MFAAIAYIKKAWYAVRLCAAAHKQLLDLPSKQLLDSRCQYVEIYHLTANPLTSKIDPLHVFVYLTLWGPTKIQRSAVMTCTLDTTCLFCQGGHYFPNALYQRADHDHDNHSWTCSITSYRIDGNKIVSILVLVCTQAAKSYTTKECYYRCLGKT